VNNPWAEPVAAFDLKSLPPAPERPKALLWKMFGWIVASTLSAAMVCFGVSLVFYAYPGHGNLSAGILIPFSAVSVQTVMLLAAFNRAKIVGWKRNRANGFGFAPIKRKGLLALLATIPILYGSLSWFGRALAPMPVFAVGDMSTEAAFAGGNTAARVVLILVIFILAPVSEELFFRGWLWTGLRRFWFPFPAMLGTALPWLLMHAMDNIYAPLSLIPQAIAFSLARHYCDSVRASLFLHLLNNSISSALMVWLYVR
jgi:membrane protease YdiL (CAAX protease family)